MKSLVPLYIKLGLNRKLNIIIINQPDEYRTLLDGIPGSILFSKKLKEGLDFIQLFTKSKKELSIEFPQLIKYVNSEGELWISWPKKSSNMVSDLDKERIIEIGRSNRMQNKKIISINADWNAIKFIHSSNGKEN